ncbi:MAG TPA: ATP-binding cassette domain-containing protein [Caldithrix abyssi]|uniref:ATP-binding cassette domain-containing protein n=1 Tax=Caldithrix abyssi TaxID=187145 RepID=A0A7V1LKX6_CALAY|nr:ATP-binding cassette domain-containing protein [Caldithrix abyssi]
MPETSRFVNIQIHSEERCLAQMDSFGFEAGKITFLLGESGIGKSLLSKVYMGILEERQLRITVNGRPYGAYASRIRRHPAWHNGFFVFQEPSSHFNPLRTIGEQLNEGQLARLKGRQGEEVVQSFWPHTRRQELRPLLKVYPKPYRPSGGEKQRLLLAMAFKKLRLYQKRSAVGDALFIFDEPSGNLDNVARNGFLDQLLSHYREKPFTAVVITHDYTIISYLNRHYPGMRDNVLWRELQRDAGESGKLQLISFPEKSFTDWLRALNPVRSHLDHSGHEILRLKSGVRIWDKNYHFFNISGEEKDLTLTRGDAVYLKAPSGIGKTTIAKIIMGLLSPSRAVLAIQGKTVPLKKNRAFYAKHIWGRLATMVFQHADEALNRQLTVEEVFKVLSEKRTVHRQKLLRRLREWFGGRTAEAFLHRPVKYLSGGQKQRLNLLRGFVQNTDILILDEPLNGLDLKSADLVIKKIQDRQRDGKALLIISHNEEIMEKIIGEENIFYLKTR